MEKNKQKMSIYGNLFYFMQIVAFTQEGKKIWADQAEKGVDYSCPECHLSLRLRKGPFRRPHFFHSELTRPCRHSNKTLQHFQIQERIQKEIGTQSVKLEVIFPQIGRIADVVWEEKKIIFEVQCSPITPQEIRERNRDYATLDYVVVWVLHDRTFNKAKLSNAEEFLLTSTHYFTNIDSRGKGAIYDQIATIKSSFRLNRKPPKRVSLSKPLFSKHPLRPLWQVHFDGDLSSEVKIVVGVKNFFEKWILAPYLEFINFILKETF